MHPLCCNRDDVVISERLPKARFDQIESSSSDSKIIILNVCRRIIFQVVKDTEQDEVKIHKKLTTVRNQMLRVRRLRWIGYVIKMPRQTTTKADDHNQNMRKEKERKAKREIVQWGGERKQMNRSKLKKKPMEMKERMDNSRALDP